MIVDGAAAARAYRADLREDAHELPELNLCSCIGSRAACNAEWSSKGDNIAAVIFVNVVEGGGFKEIDEIAGEP
jgi:hypothetical protein